MILKKIGKYIKHLIDFCKNFFKKIKGRSAGAGFIIFKSKENAQNAIG